MLEYLVFIEKILGPYAAVADFLGYSLRHYYNLRRKAVNGEPFVPHVRIHILDKVALLKTQNLKESPVVTKNNISRIGRNVGRIEFLAAMKKIKAMLEAGYDRKKIHAKLTEDGHTTMSYSTFCSHMTKLPEEGGQACSLGTSPFNSSSRTKPLKNQPEATSVPRGYATKTDPFKIDKNKTLEDLA
jgi:hypothetical protein